MNKQIKIKLYAKALAEIVSRKGGISSSEEKRIIDNFIKLLVRTGYDKKSKEILNLAENLILAKNGKRKITFETAREISASQKKSLNNFIKKGDIITEKINPDLIAGIKIIINGARQFDSSLQSKLQWLTK